MLELPDGRDFAQAVRGVCRFRFAPAFERDRTDRIHVPVEIEGLQTTAIVDTGGVYLVIDPDFAEALNLNRDNALETTAVQIRGLNYKGNLHRLSLTLIADTGHSVSIDATSFVPDLEPGDRRELPTYLGLHGCLERLCFAIDPHPDALRFFFGSID